MLSGSCGEGDGRYSAACKIVLQLLKCELLESCSEEFEAQCGFNDRVPFAFFGGA